MTSLKNFFTLHLLCGVRYSGIALELPSNDPELLTTELHLLIIRHWYTHHALSICPHNESMQSCNSNLRLLKIHTALTPHCSEYTLSTGSQKRDGHCRYSPLPTFYTLFTLGMLLENTHLQPKMACLTLEMPADYSKKATTSHLIQFLIALDSPCDRSRMTFSYSLDTRGLQPENHRYSPATTGIPTRCWRSETRWTPLLLAIDRFLHVVHSAYALVKHSFPTKAGLLYSGNTDGLL